MWESSRGTVIVYVTLRERWGPRLTTRLVICAAARKKLPLTLERSTWGDSIYQELTEGQLSLERPLRPERGAVREATG